MKKRIIRSLLLSTVLLSALTACGTGGSKENSSSKKDGDYTITTVRWSDWGDAFTKGYLEEAEKNSGIEIDWDVHVAADWTDKKAVLLAGGDLPDAFLGSNVFNDSEIAQNQALFIPLEDLIEKHMPNLSKILKENPKMKAMITSPDGHIYSLPKKSPMRPTISNQVFINKKWLDNLNLEMPDTYEEFIKVLEAFKNEDANGNGDKNDEIPFGAGNVSETFMFILPFNNRLGADNTMEMSVKNDKPVYLRAEESYKEGIKWMSEAYKKGLIDPELYTQDESMASAKRMDKEVSRVGVSGGWTADATFGLHADEYVAMTPLKGPDGNRYVLSDPDHYNYARNELLITKNCEKPEELLKWADQFYTDDASIQTFYGSFDIATEKTGTGYKVLAPKDGKSADEWAWINSLRDFGPKYVTDDFNSKVDIDDTQGDGLKLKLDEEIKQYALPAFPNVTYSQEELTRLSAIYVDIDSYAKQMTSKWVVEGGIDKEWDGYIKQLKAMGLDKFMEIQTKAYERYQSITE
ncbi:extracellular solute-binding protein [Streptococcus ovis]|uniref:extracellular solute-binding protein n=1 Tax=Streptococcus ovis TaxID=82806 RepID=UPI00036302DA|nr:extracellular solute-binding protein [Streptococcus ovis]